MIPSNFLQLIQTDIDNKDYSKAELKILQWIEQTPDNPHAWSYLGFVYSRTQKRLAAYAAHQKSVQLAPNVPLFLSNLANVHIPLGKAAEGVKYLRKAVELEPENASYKQNLAYILRDACLYDEAIPIQRELVAQFPDNAQKRFDLGFMLLHTHNLEEGWKLYNSRAVRPDRKALFDAVGQEYTGQDLSGKSLLIIGEQGFGDTILMLRFLEQITAQTDQVSLISRAPLFPLLTDLNITLYDQYELPDDFDAKSYDYAVYMMNLPQIFEPDWLKWPKPSALPVPQDSKDKMAKIFHARHNKLKVGIVWSGSVTFMNNHLRSVEYTRFLQMAADHPDIQFYSLQKGPREQDILDHGMGSILPIGQKLDNFGDTAAALEHLDLIIMTDSGLAHLAGTQDVPVLNLLNFLHYWLYFPRDGAKTPLYDSWRFIRQPSEGDWDAVFTQVNNILKAIGQNAPKQPSRADILKVIDFSLSGSSDGFIYDDTRFKPKALDDKKRIILTGDTDSRWERETPVFGQALIDNLKLTPDHTVLDYGVGVGRLAKYLIDTCGCRVIGVDISQDMLDASVSYVQSDLYQPMSVEAFQEQYKDLNVDAAYSIWVLQHCLNVDEILDQLHTALSGDGALWVTNTYNRALPVAKNKSWADDGVDMQSLITQRFGPMAQDLTEAVSGCLPDNHQGRTWSHIWRKAP